VWQNITDDGKVRKLVLEPGTGEPPAVLTRCYVFVRGELEDGTVFLDSMDEEYDFMLGQAQVPKGMEIALVGMKPGELVHLDVGEGYGWSMVRRPDEVPVDCKRLWMTVQLCRSEKEKNLHTMTPGDKLEFCRARRDLGKQLFSKGMPLSALKQYSKALLCLDDKDPKADADDDFCKEKRELQLLYFTNSAQCHFKVRDWNSTITFCNKALTIDPTHKKALYRKAVALRYKEEWDESEQVLKQVLPLLVEANSSENERGQHTPVIKSVNNELAVIAKAKRKVTAQQRTKFGGMFAKQEQGGPAATFYADKPDISDAPAPTGTPITSQIPVTISPGTFPQFLWAEARKALLEIVNFLTTPCRKCKRSKTD